MPLFEYSCKACSHQFEALVRGSDAPECPACRGRDLERKLSVFAAHTAGAPKSVSAGPLARRSPGEGGCGSCGDPRGPGACSMN